MKARYEVSLLTVTLLAASLVLAPAEETSQPNSQATPSDSDYVLDNSDQIPPVPILRLEKELGVDLTPEQEAELKKAHRERVQEVVGINKKFIGQVSEITGLEPKEILPRNRLGRANALRAGTHRPAAGKRAGIRDARAEGRFLDRLDLIMEAKGDNLTGGDRRQVDRAWDDRTEAVLAVQKDFARDVAKIAKVSFTKVKRLLNVA